MIILKVGLASAVFLKFLAKAMHSLVPRLLGELLFAHALILFDIPKFLDFSGYIRVMLMSPAN